MKTVRIECPSWQQHIEIERPEEMDTERQVQISDANKDAESISDTVDMLRRASNVVCLIGLLASGLTLAEEIDSGNVNLAFVAVFGATILVALAFRFFARLAAIHAEICRLRSAIVRNK